MAAETGSFVAGHYTAGYGVTPADLGTTEQGFSVRAQYYKDDIRVDDYGDSIVDGIFRGYNLRFNARLCEWTAAGRAAVQFPFDTTIGTVVAIGHTMVGGGFAKQMALVPVAGINAANKTYTLPLSVPDGDHGGWNLNNHLRVVDLNMIAIVNRATGVLFTET